MTPYFDNERWPAFLSAIKAAPDDDLPRLVAADFIEEHGDAERAQFIRLQVELAKGPQCRWAGPGANACGEWNEHLPVYRVETWCRECDQHRINYGRMSALADGIYGPLLGPVALAGGTWVVERGFLSRISAPLSVLHGADCSLCSGFGRFRIVDNFFTHCTACNGTGRTPGVLAELLRREPLTAEGIEITESV